MSLCFYLADPITRRRKTRVFCAGQTLAELAPVWAHPFVASVNGQAVLRAHWAQPLQAGDVPDTYADVADLVEQFHYKPATTVEEGINRFVDWYRDYQRASI